jgi:HAD superfamily hydrolase (TIGR01509 family)
MVTRPSGAPAAPAAPATELASRPTARISGVLFDHDGTLVDSLAMVVEATNRVLAGHGRSVVSAPVIIADMVYPTIERMARHAQVSDPALQRRLAADFVVAARSSDPALARPYPGIAALVGALGARGVAMAVVSNNDGVFVRRVMAEHGFEGAFACVYGEEDMPAPKPDPRGIIQAAAEMARRAEECLFVGDSGGDAAGAHAAGMRAVGVTWGIHTRVQLAGMGFDWLIDQPVELLGLLG